MCMAVSPVFLSTYLADAACSRMGLCFIVTLRKAMHVTLRLFVNSLQLPSQIFYPIPWLLQNIPLYPLLTLWHYHLCGYIASPNYLGVEGPSTVTCLGTIGIGLKCGEAASDFYAFLLVLETRTLITVLQWSRLESFSHFLKPSKEGGTTLTLWIFHFLAGRPVGGSGNIILTLWREN